MEDIKGEANPAFERSKGRHSNRPRYVRRRPAGSTCGLRPVRARANGGCSSTAGQRIGNAVKLALEAPHPFL